MVSVNSSASVALQSLQSINSQLQTTQNRLSTGLKVASAQDGASAWAAATALRSDISTYDQINTSLDLSKSSADLAQTGAETIATALNSLSTQVTTYLSQTSTTDKAQTFAQIQSLQNQIKTALASSTEGSDWLNTTGTVTITVGLDSSGAAINDTLTKVDVGTDMTTAISANITNSILDFDQTDLDGANAADISSALSTNYTTVNGYDVTLSNLSTGIASQQTALTSLSNAKQSAVDNLVDADMSEESTRLSALQVQQQLAIQVLSMINASSQNILRLFQ